MQTLPLSQSDKTDLLADWLNAVNRLVSDISVWAQEDGWTVRADQIEITEEALGPYTAPMLEIDTPDGRLILEPIARIVFRGEGRVDFYAWPTLFRVMLLYKPTEKRWIVRTDSGINWPHPWNRETFVAIGKGLLKDE